MRSTHLDSSRVEVLDPLRGIAALGVAWYHFSGRDPNSIIRLSGAYGKYGVQVFFVISGFVIPYALSQSDYRLKDYPRFILKRVLRLDPPYIVSILLMLLLIFLSFASHGFEGPPAQEISAVQLLLHLGYANTFFDYPWILPVYWTLAIEFQFYLLIGLLYPLVSSRSALLRNTTLACLGSTFLLTRSDLLVAHELVSHHVLLFLLGIVTYQYRKMLIGGSYYLIALALLTLCLMAGVGVAVALFGLGTALAITFLKTAGGLLKFFGKISYSVYLTHASVGSAFLDFTLRRVEGVAARLCLDAVALGITILSAYMLYRLVELPSQRWSASIRYKREPERAAVPKMIDVESL